jgi:hypothetical protein
MEAQMAAQVVGRLSMRWIPVADASGRTHMEAVWITGTAPVEVPVTTTHAA